MNSYVCDCVTGFDGTNCENNIDDCGGVDCGTGTCIDGVDSFSCDCLTDTSGRNCEFDCASGALTPTACATNAAAGNGDCTLTYDGNAGSDYDLWCGDDDDKATLSCIPYGANCDWSEGCIRNHWIRYDMGEIVSISEFRFRMGWWTKRPDNFEIWVSDSTSDLPDAGATLVLEAAAEEPGYVCEIGEVCVLGTTPAACCTDGYESPQVEAGLLSLWEHYYPAIGQGCYWYFRTLKTVQEPGLAFQEIEFTGCAIE